MQDEQFIRNRITSLRLRKNVSEYRMSLDLGHSDSYIRSISSGKALPSMAEFLYMCEYLGVTPAEFFAEENNSPFLIHCLSEISQHLGEDDLQLLLNVASRLSASPSPELHYSTIK